MPRGRTGIGLKLTEGRTAQAWARRHRHLRAALTPLVQERVEPARSDATDLDGDDDDRVAAMNARFRALVEFVLAGAALVGAGRAGRTRVTCVAVAPIADGQPATTSLVYNPQLLLLTMLLATIAGVLAVVGAARLWRALRR